MYHLARVLVLGENASRSRQISNRLRLQGYAAFAGDFGVIKQKLTPHELPDLVLVNASSGNGKAYSLADRLKTDPDTRHIPVVMMVDEATPDVRRRCLDGGIDDLLVDPVADGILFSRLAPLLRLTTMHSELKNRIASLRDLGLDVPEPVLTRDPQSEYRVLAVQGSGTDMLPVEQALRRGCELVWVSDPFVAHERLIAEHFDAVILPVDDATTDDALYLCGQLRSNTRLFNLPVLLVADGRTFVDPAEPYRSGASMVLYRPVDPDEMRPSLLTLVRRQRLRRAIREAFSALPRQPVSDEATGLYNAEFLDVHLARLVNSAKAWRKHLSMLCFTIQNLTGIRQRFGAEVAEQLLRQAGGWVSGLVRIEDVAARSGETEFCVVLPDTAHREAEIVGHRVSGILQYTDFSVKGLDQPLGLWAQTGVAGLERGDSAASLMERVRRNLL